METITTRQGLFYLALLARAEQRSRAVVSQALALRALANTLQAADDGEATARATVSPVSDFDPSTTNSGNHELTIILYRERTRPKLVITVTSRAWSWGKGLFKLWL